MTGDICLAEDVAQEAVADALAEWPSTGIPTNPGVWLTTVAKREAIDAWNRRRKLEDRYRSLAQDLDDYVAGVGSGHPIEDDVLRLVFTACHPVLGREAQIALTLRIIGGLSTAEIARMFFVPVATIQQRIVRAKATLGAAKITFEVPERNEWQRHIGSVLGVAYLIFTEGYAPTTGDHWIRRDLGECHATAEMFDHTDWHRIVLLYEALGSIATNPIVDLNRAVAVSMAMSPATALAIVDRVDSDGALRGSYLLPSVRGELLAKLGRTDEARSELLTAARLATNSRERDVLLAKVDGLQ
ncbi:MAG: hypothetical protein LH475_09010 [Cryobacterium sp.]|uniref:RNA polymerase sigma factor n=1 Tax=Cryobacterium sp. TaxID=1926290 RepID=UPI002294C367|nr:sigma factor-like helix-turn-helix DNA-binding protein [Cryobacterium sp.]MCY7404751.1 hypothetical protein [Cryobacterium sp.]